MLNAILFDLDLAGATAAGLRTRLVDTVLNAERLSVLMGQERVRRNA